MPPSWTTWPSRSVTHRSTLFDEIELVGRDDEGGTVAMHCVEQLEQRDLPGGVEADERLVDEQHIERPDQRERDRRLLSQAAAEAGGEVVGTVVQPRHEPRRSAACRSQSSTPWRRACTRGAPTRSGRRRTSACRTGTTSPPRARAIRPGDRSPRPRRRSGSSSPATILQQGGLARTVVADQHDGLTWAHAEVERHQRRRVAIRLLQLHRGEHRRRAGWLRGPGEQRRARGAFDVRS